MTFRPMTPAGALAALEKIRCPDKPDEMRKCVSKMRIIAHFAKLDSRNTPVKAAFSLIADHTGMSVNTVRARVQELEEDHVLVIRKGSGTRPQWYQLEPDIFRWRGFRWSVPVSFVAQQVGFGTGELSVEPPALHINAYDARQMRVAKQPMDRATKKLLSRSAWPARQDEGLCVDLPGAPRDKGPSSYKYSRVDEVSSSKEEEEVVNKVAAVIKRQTHAGFFNGPPLTKLRALVKAGATADELLALLPKLPSDAGVPAAMLWLEQEWYAKDVVVDIRPPEPVVNAGPVDPYESSIHALELAGEFEEAEALRQQREEA